jgi:DNA-binding NtrC family response regulator
VDDQPMMLRLCQSILEDMGYRTLKAACGDEARRILAQEAPEVALMITDIVMTTDQEGLDLAEDVGRAYPHIQVIYMSGYARGRRLSELLRDPAILFLHKPFMVADLTDMVRRAEAKIPMS